MKPCEALREAKKLIEAGWCRKGGSGHTAHARDSAGHPVPLFTGERKVHPDAASFTAYGAIAAVMATNRVERTALVFDVLYQVAQAAMGTIPMGGANYVHPLLAFNEAEGREQGQVADLFEVAALRAEEIGDGPFPSPIPLPTEASLRGPG